MSKKEKSLNNKIQQIYSALGTEGIKELLKPYIPDIVRLNGETKGNVRCCYPENHSHGDRNPSLSVDLKKGLLHCFVCGDKIPGGMLEFVAQKRGIKNLQLINELAIQHDLLPDKSGLNKTLNLIREGGLKQHERRDEIAQSVREELSRKGKFIKTQNNEAYYFDESKHKLYEIHKDNEQFAVLLYKLGELNQADPDWKYVFNDLRLYTLSKGQESDVWKFTRWDNGKLYLSRFDGTMYVLDGENIETKNNGSDGVLFIDRNDWEPWMIEESKNEFGLKELIGQINFDTVDPSFDGITLEEYRQLFATCLLSQFFIDLLPTKPLLLFLGEKGSGKTSIIRQVGKLIFGSNFDVKTVERGKEDAFTAMVAAHFMVPLDNVDTSITWLNDALATTATGNKRTLRKLYTTATEKEIWPRCFVWLSSRTPYFRRDDVSDRLIILRLKRLPIGKFIQEGQLLRQIAENRAGLLHELLQKLNTIVAYLNKHDISQDCVNFRLADFAALGKAIWTALGGEEAAGAWERILNKMQVEQEDFALEDDPLPLVILEWMGDDNEKGPICPNTLFTELQCTAEQKSMDFTYKNARSIGKRLSNIKSTFEDRLNIKITQSKGRSNITLRTFKKIKRDG